MKIITSLAVVLAATVLLSGCAKLGMPLPNKVKIPAISSELLHARMQDLQQKTIILDVREENEYLEAHIPSAHWFPKSRFDRGDPELLAKLKEFGGDSFFVVYCGAGHRSSYVTRKLLKMGYDVQNLDGISFWRSKSLPIVLGPKRPPSSEPAMILLEEAYEHYYLLFKDIVWVDVRDHDDFHAGHIKGAISMPLSDLQRDLGQLPRDKEIVLYCEGTYKGGECGASLSAARILIDSGFSAGKLKVFEDGYYAWQDAGYPVTAKSRRSPKCCGRY